MLCSSASLGASSSLGDDVILGHRAAVKDHIVIASRTRVAAKSGVVRDITEVGDYAGHPAVPAEDFKQQVRRRGEMCKADLRSGAPREPGLTAGGIRQTGKARPERPAERQSSAASRPVQHSDLSCSLSKPRPGLSFGFEISGVALCSYK